jgi:hypothetical protein
VLIKLLFFSSTLFSLYQILKSDLSKNGLRFRQIQRPGLRVQAPSGLGPEGQHHFVDELLSSGPTDTAHLETILLGVYISAFHATGIEEIYFDAEYMKEGCRQYLKQVRCLNGKVSLRLKKNKQIKNLMAPALASEDGWESHAEGDELKTIDVTLPKTHLSPKIAILRDLETARRFAVSVVSRCH